MYDRQFIINTREKMENSYGEMVHTDWSRKEFVEQEGKTYITEAVLKHILVNCLVNNHLFGL